MLMESDVIKGTYRNRREGKFIISLGIAFLPVSNATSSLSNSHPQQRFLGNVPDLIRDVQETLQHKDKFTTLSGRSLRIQNRNF